MSREPEYQDVRAKPHGGLSGIEWIIEVVVGLGLLTAVYLGISIAGLPSVASSAISVGTAGLLWPATFRWLRHGRRRRG